MTQEYVDPFELRKATLKMVISALYLTGDHPLARKREAELRKFEAQERRYKFCISLFEFLNPLRQ